MYNLFFSKNISEFITADILFLFLIYFMYCLVCIWLCICIHQFLCTIWWVLTNIYNGIITTTTLSIEITSIPQNVSYRPFCEMSSSFPLSTGVWQILTFFTLCRFTLFRISYKWNYAACTICFCFFSPT